MKKLLLTLFCLTFALAVYPIYFKHIGIKDGLSQLSVMSIYQDELGRMWFGTMEGVSRYDGTQTVAFKPSGSGSFPVYMGNINDPVTGDKNGSVFFRSDYTLIRYDLHRQKFECLKDRGVNTVTFCNGKVWAVVADSLFYWDKATQALHYTFTFGLPGNVIQHVFITPENTYWIGTRNGLYYRDTAGKTACLIPSEDIYSLFADSKGNLWIASRLNGLYLRKPSGEIAHWKHDPSDPNTIANDQVRSITEDNQGNIWIGTFTGLNKYNPDTGRFSYFTKDALPGSLAHASVFSVYKDRQGSIWVGTYYGGVHYFNPETDLFTYYPENEERDNCLSFSFTGNMVEDKDGNVWICTEGGGLNFFDRKTRKFTHFLASSSSANSIAHNNLKSICYSASRHTLYIGTHTGGLSIYDIGKKKFRNLLYEMSGYQELAGDVVNEVRLYKDRYLIFLTQKGLLKMDLLTEELTPLFKERKINWSTSFTIDSQNNIWIAQGSSIQKIDLEDESSSAIYHSPVVALGHFSFSKILEDRKGRIFCGSLGAGLFYLNPDTRQFVQYTAGNDLLQSDYCYDIVQSREGYLIISGNKGITFFDPDKKIVKAVDLTTGLPISGINNGCGLLVCRDGEIFVGGTDGAASFFERELFSSAKDYSLYFSNLSINNELVSPASHPQVLREALPFIRQIELNHNQNNLIFTFTSNNYVNTLKKTAYEYKLGGFDEKWISTTNHDIWYTNLSPGTYTLVVKEQQSDPNVLPQNIQMEIVIRSPWYATPVSYLVYMLVITGIIYSFIRFKQSQLVLQNSLELERQEKEQIENLNQAKLQFFSNISHEFRTPLTLIISQIELLLQSSSLVPAVYNKILKIYKNTYQMRNLITELLDFRKLEQGHVTLKICEQDIVSFLKEIYLSFYEYADTHSIRYQFTSSQEKIACWFDARQMQKVFYNLLSNAFKYSSPNGNIEIVIGETDTEIVVQVMDNGIGIEKQDIDKIFDRFYQSENSVSDGMKTPGTGIGLSLTKNIIELHHGSIQVESTPGYGSIFVVRLKKGRLHFAGGECAILENLPDLPVIKPDTLPEPLFGEQLSEKETGMPEEENSFERSILIVEDNEELLQILSSLFAPLYRVIIARNGEEGLRKAQEGKPDIILSDVMMPVMSGTEMCLKIKADFDLCHIPVVLLTALTSAEQNIEGLQRGADDYINKPFNTRILLARCNNLIRNRIILQKKFSRQADFDTHSLAGNPIDQHFLDTVNAIIEKNLDNMDFDMNTLAKELGLSRSSLYAKFKALTGLTPNDFVLNCKLKKAARMLRNNPELQIADISDRLGFGSPRYFSRCFKAQFAVTPMEYRKKEQ